MLGETRLISSVLPFVNYWPMETEGHARGGIDKDCLLFAGPCCHRVTKNPWCQRCRLQEVRRKIGNIG